MVGLVVGLDVIDKGTGSFVPQLTGLQLISRKYPTISVDPSRFSLHASHSSGLKLEFVPTYRNTPMSVWPSTQIEV